MVKSTVRNVAVLVLVLTSVVRSAPPKKFPFGKARAGEPEPNQAANDVLYTSENQSQGSNGSASEETLEKQQAKSAQYSYDTSVNDTINDHAITRQEERNGLSLKGMYSYSDGFFKRTVHYEADDRGYRVVKEINIPIGKGPQVNPKGKADVSSSLAGSYSITADDIAKPKRKEVPLLGEVVSSESPLDDDHPEEQNEKKGNEKEGSVENLEKKEI